MIHLDLTKLTQEQLDRAFANLGSCTYSGPCVLGAMMPASLIKELAEDDGETLLDASPLSHLIQRGMVSFPEEQLGDARYIQRLYDKLPERDSRADLQVVLNRWNPALVVPA